MSSTCPVCGFRDPAAATPNFCSRCGFDLRGAAVAAASELAAARLGDCGPCIGGRDHRIAHDLARFYGTDPETQDLIKALAMTDAADAAGDEEVAQALARKEGTDPQTMALVAQLEGVSLESAVEQSCGGKRGGGVPAAPPDDAYNLGVSCPHCGLPFAADLKRTACRIYICGFVKKGGRVVQHTEGTRPEDLWMGCGKQFELVEDAGGKKYMRTCTGK